jgi:hypothetical protein
MMPDQNLYYQPFDYEKRNEEAKAIATTFGGGLLSSMGQHIGATVNRYKEGEIISRALDAQKFPNVDSTFKKAWINNPDNISNHITDLFSKYIPPSKNEYVPADLTLAGKYKDQLKNLSPVNMSTDIITVTPGPNPARFASSDINPETLNKDISRGYVWGNTEEPQFGYATGNYNKKAVSSVNPSIYFANLDLSSTPETNFYTTTDVAHAPELTENRVWGQKPDLDAFFPKEVTRARGEVTATDLYTAIKNKGETPPTFRPNIKGAPGTFLNDLANQYANLNNKSVKESLLDLASPVPALGESLRERGSIPYNIKYDFSQASPEQLKKIGLTDEPNSLFRLGGREGNWMREGLPDVPNLQRNSELGYSNQNSNGTDFENPIYKAFKNIDPDDDSFIFSRKTPKYLINSGAGVGSLLYTPEIIDSLGKGKYADAATQAGTGLITGSISDALIRGGVVQAAKAGITAPARALAVAGPLAAPLALVSQLGGSSRINKKFDEAAANAQILRAEAARKRGGKWKFPTPFGQVTIPEFGLSESGGLFFR